MLPDILLLLGAGCVSAALFLVSLPLGLGCTGLMLLIAARALSRSRKGGG